MKRWPIIALVSLALIVLLSPAIIGRLAERSVDDSLGRIVQENDEIRAITPERLDRGWFTTQGQYRIVLNDGLLASLVNESTNPTGDNPAAIVIETRIDHGLVPLGSLGRERGSLQPGLARGESTLRLDTSDGRSIRLPGIVHSFISLGGDSSFHYLAGPDQHVDGNRRSEWSGADLTLTVSSDGGRLTLDGIVQPLSAESNGVVTRIGTVSVDLNQDRSRFPLGIGSLALSVDSIGVVSAGSTDANLDNLKLTTDFNLDDDRISGDAKLTLSDLVLGDALLKDLVADIDVQGVDAQGLAAIVNAFGVSNAGSPDLRPVDATFQTLLDRGGQFSLNALEFTLPEGNWSSSLNVDWKAADQDTGYFSLPGFLLRLTANADVSVSRGIFEQIAALYPEARYLLDNDILLGNGDTLSMTAAFSKGRMTINGEPFAIPLGIIR